MFRLIASSIASIVLFAIEMFIVMKLNQYPSIRITNYAVILPILACNFFLAFTAITQLMPWLEKIRIIQATEPEN